MERFVSQLRGFLLAIVVYITMALVPIVAYLFRSVFSVDASERLLWQETFALPAAVLTYAVLFLCVCSVSYIIARRELGMLVRILPALTPALVVANGASVGFMTFRGIESAPLVAWAITSVLLFLVTPYAFASLLVLVREERYGVASVFGAVGLWVAFIGWAFFYGIMYGL